MKIVVVGLGYVGLSNAVLLAQHNQVIGIDISQERVMPQLKQSPIVDIELSKYLEEKTWICLQLLILTPLSSVPILSLYRPHKL